MEEQSTQGPIRRRDLESGADDVTRSQRDKRGRFLNPWPTWRYPSSASLLRFYLLDQDHSNLPRSTEELDRELPVMEPYFVQRPEQSGVAGGLRVTWLGHASLLLEMDGLVLLTDPMFSQRAFPVQFIGPKRFRGPPCTVAQLPVVHAVLISHNHYDHLDTGSVASLNQRFGGELHWFVPLGLMDWMQKSGCENVVELDWWEESSLPGPWGDGPALVFTPAQHWCKRTPTDDNKVPQP